MAFTRDLERLARQFKNQRLDAEYIRHYLLETYQADPQVVTEILRKLGMDEDWDDGNPMNTRVKRGGKNDKKKNRFGDHFH